MIELKQCIEIYITNECNLTCSNCNRYNNYDFRGHFYWEENKTFIQAWAQKITAPSITIIGGEPSIHPDLESWVKGIAAAWPNRPVAIQTNGIKEIFNYSWWPSIQKKYPNIGITVAIHNENFKSKFNNNYGEKQQFDAMMFSDCTLIPDDTYFRVHDSKPQQAWGACTMRYSHTILNGLLYRCPMVAVLPEFKKQYEVKMTEQQYTLLHAYKPLHPDCSDQELIEFRNASEYEMLQCGLCPESYKETLVTFDASRKKFFRINKSS